MAYNSEKASLSDTFWLHVILKQLISLHIHHLVLELIQHSSVLSYFSDSNDAGSASWPLSYWIYNNCVCIVNI
jgi:hypothetical protein